MDVPLAPPVVSALTRAVEFGDTGYPVGRDYVQALDGFARQRWGWDGIAPDRAALVPDVMLGVVELLQLITEPGRRRCDELPGLSAVLPVR